MKQILVLLICLFAAGCATERKYNYMLDSWVGHGEDDLIQAWGAPAGSYQVSSDKKILTYMENLGQRSTTNYSPYIRVANTYTTDDSCKTQFFVKNGLVESWRWDGTCRAY